MEGDDPRADDSRRRARVMVAHGNYRLAPDGGAERRCPQCKQWVYILCPDGQIFARHTWSRNWEKALGLGIYCRVCARQRRAEWEQRRKAGR